MDQERAARTLYDSLAESAKKFPENNAIDFYGKKLSYSQLKSFADRFASLLRAMQIEKGDRVAICSHNCPQFVISLYGASKIGAISVPINPEYKEREILNVLSDCGAKLLICEDCDLPVEKVRKIHIKADPLNREDELFNILKKMEPDVRETKVDDDDVALIMYTSGTASAPKGVVLTHKNVMANALSGSLWCNKSEKDRSLAALPFSHILGLVESLCGSILCGSEVVILKKFSTEDATEAIEREKCTICTGVPPIFKALSRNNNRDLSSLRVCFVGGAPMDEQDIEAFEKRAGCELLEGYGLTESAAQLTINPPKRAKHGSVGIPIYDVSFKIIGEDGKELGAKEVGELVFKGPQIMKGYWKNEKETDKILKDGWLYTGDLGYFDDDNYIYLKGRKDEIINISGYKVLPEEIESILISNEKVREVCAIGSREGGKDSIKAFVVLKKEASERELIEWCRSRLSSYKCPSKIEFVDALPRSASGKILRRALK